MTPRITASTSPDLWPVYLTIREVALILGVSVRTIQNRCSRGAMDPPPVMTLKAQYRRPLRWKRDVVKRVCDGKAA